MKNKWLSVLFKKIAAFFISILVLSAIVFFLSRITPIDPLQSYYGERVEKMSEEQKDSARERLGLNDPIPVQYVRWLKLALSGDFGISYKYKQDVTIVIKERIQNTLILGVLSYVILFIGALLLGGLAFGVVLKKFVWPAIKADPVANLILPVATALLTSLLLCLLETQR